MHQVLADETRERQPKAMFFARCGPKEFQALTGHVVSDLWPQELDPEERQPEPGDRAWWWNSESIGEGLDSRTVDLDAQEPVSSWLEILLESTAADRDQWEVILQAAVAPVVAELAGLEHPQGLDRGALMGIEAAYPRREGSRALWNLFWCLPPLTELPTLVQSSLRAVGLRPYDDDSNLWESWAEPGRRFLEYNESDFDFLEPMPHRRLRDAPIVVAPVGRTALPILPRTLRLPVEFDQLRSETTDALGQALERTGWARTISETVYAGEGVTDGPSGENAWVEVSMDGAVRPHPDLLTLVAILGETVEEMVPSFVSHRYQALITVSLPNTWGAGGKLHLRLKSRSDPGAVFDLEDSAEGLQLWLQLGLLEALELIADSVASIGAWADALAVAYQDVDFVPPESVDEAHERTEAAQTRLDALLSDLDEAERLTIEPADGEHDYLSIIPSGSYPASLVGAVQLVRGRLYLIDEPERHLHPRLQREAARWLSGTIRRHGSQAVIATHSVPFLGLGEGVAHSYLWRRDAERTVLQALDPSSLSHLDQEAEELGFDRGELMTLVNVFLWVEGRMDQAVLEGLFAEELRRYGIAVVPMHSVSRYKGVLDAEALLRFTAAKAAVWFDNLPTEFVARLKNEPEYALEARGDQSLSSECRAAADLTLAARQRELEIEILEHPGQDVFDLLDEDAVREQFPEFPGHQEAAEAWRAEAERKGRKAGERKSFLFERFKVELSPASCRAIAENMRATGRRPTALVSVIEACERLALELD